MNWIEILGNVASGGLLGLLGTAVNFALGYFKQKQEHRQRLEWAKDERETLALRGQLTAAQTAGDLAVAREKGAGEAFTASVEAEGRIASSYRWVDAVRALTRPGLTFLLVVLAAFLRFSADAGTRAYIDQNIVVTAVAAVTWWFGQRQLDRATTTWGNQTAGATVSTK
jgi:hypothetical protein